MNTFLLKMGCFCLFGFIFFQSFQTEFNSNVSPLLGQQKQIELIEQKTAVIAVDANYSSVANYETIEGNLEHYLEQ